MIKVLHFVSTPSIGSGVMSVIMNYYRHIDRTKVRFDFLCFIPCEESYEKEISSLGGQVFFVPKPGTSMKALTVLKDFFQKKGTGYTWLHNHEVYLSFLLKPLCQKYGIRNFIIHCHATRYSDSKSAAIRNMLFCLPIHMMKTTYDNEGQLIFCVKRVACSKASGKFLFGNTLLKTGKVSIFYNAISFRQYQFCEPIRKELRKELGIENRFVIGHVGRFVPQKNHNFILKVFSNVMEEWCNICNNKSNIQDILRPLLVLIGDGPDRAKIEKRVIELGLSSDVIFLGHRKDVSELYNIMDIFILPSLYEGLPVSCVEAQANGLTCLVSSEITEEIAYTNLVQFLSIKQGAFLWKKKIFKVGGRNAQFNFSRIPDIQNEVHRLLHLYQVPG